jgi:oxygen-independent coproporphyrinogen-3 oxidase
MAREAGFNDINMDVIAGLPGETPADFAYTLERIEDLRPDSLTVHTLAIKRSSRLHLTGAALPPAGAVAEMTDLARPPPRGSGWSPTTSTGRSTWPVSSRTWATPARARRACTTWT